MSYEEDDVYWNNYKTFDKRSLRKAYSNGAHVPNKNEATLLRKIMSESGLTEEEVRANKKYRKMLSEAQDKGENSTISRVEKEKKRILKEITKELKLAKEHPLVVAEFKKRLSDSRFSRFAFLYR